MSLTFLLALALLRDFPRWWPITVGSVVLVWLATLFTRQHHLIDVLTGILLAHVFFNMPLAARMVLSGLEAIPYESERLSAQLGFTPAQHWRHVEWPAVRQVLPGTLLLVGTGLAITASNFDLA